MEATCNSLRTAKAELRKQIRERRKRQLTTCSLPGVEVAEGRGRISEKRPQTAGGRPRISEKLPRTIQARPLVSEKRPRKAEDSTSEFLTVSTAESKLRGRIIEILATLPVAPKTVAAYVEIPTEPPVLETVEEIYGLGVSLLLPKTTMGKVSGSKTTPAWQWFSGKKILVSNPKTLIREPAGCGLSSQVLAQVDAVILPGLAGDIFGNRLGQGGGWYDQALTFVPPNVPRILVLWDEEIWQSPLPVEAHDKKVTHIVTPNMTVVCEKSQ